MRPVSQALGSKKDILFLPATGTKTRVEHEYLRFSLGAAAIHSGTTDRQACSEALPLWAVAVRRVGEQGVGTAEAEPENRRAV
jgi:hypothetical protein